MSTLTKKELARSAKDIRAKIAELSKLVDGEIKPFRSVCDELAAARSKYDSALASYTKKASDKNATKLERAKGALGTAWGIYCDSYDKLDDKKKAVLLKYDRLIEVAEAVGSKELAKAKKEMDAFLASFNARLAKARGDVLVNLPSFLALTPVKEEPKVETLPTADAVVTSDGESRPSAPAPSPATAASSAPSATATVASVGIAPVTIDISAYVERAISATMDRLTVGMERKIADYISSFTIPSPESSAPAPASTAPVADKTLVDGISTTAKANNELLTHILEEQTHVYEKLRGMITNIQKLVDGITEMSASYMELAEKQRDAVEVHKQINDLQRHTSREQQGLQVNQKMIAEEQIAVLAEQSTLTDVQKALLDKIKTLTESQRAMAETQKTVVETHVALEEAMKAVMQAQKEIIATQQALINGNAKNQDAQKQILERQAEIAAAQKEALAAQKALLRDQRAVTDKATGRTKPRTKHETDPADDTDVTVVSPVVTDKGTPAPDVSTLSADDEFRG